MSCVEEKEEKPHQHIADQDVVMPKELATGLERLLSVILLALIYVHTLPKWNLTILA